MAFQVQTVLGPLDVRKLGRTLTHEHLSAAIEQPGLFYTPPPDQIKSMPINDTEITLQNFGFVRQYPYSNKANIVFNDDATRKAVLYEMEIFRKAGGGSIVENTSHGLKRDLGLMLQASKDSGVNIIAGTGFYVHQVHPPSVLESSVETLANVIRKDLTEGCEEMPEIKCGVIAEVGSGWPITAFERHAIQATATVQAEVGCGVSFHPGRDSAAPAEIARIYLEAGGDKEKAVMSHLDRTISDKAELLEFAKTGFYCQFDLFGMEASLYQLSANIDMPSDAQRIDRIKWLLEDGRKDKVLMSHDVGTKHRLMNFGGHGFSHVLLNVAPQMLQKGVPQETIDNLLIDNPRQWLGVNPNHHPFITLD